jgi:serine/threonine-protein kinase
MSAFPHLGRYQIERLLGQGSYGSVYLAVDPQLQQQVVLKVLKDDLVADANTRQWFTGEAKSLAQLSGLAQFEKVYNFFESHQPPYLVMEAVSGQTLDAYLGRGGRSIEEALPILQQIAAALDTAHKNGLLHGDLRPSSVLLQQNQRLQVIDFGLVKRVPSAEAMRDVPNAPAQFLFYIAPEQADINRRSEIASATDIYALGVIAYQMLTGRLPFEGHHEAILEGHRHHPPTDALFFNPNLPPPVEELLKKVLSKQPRERYVTAEAFVKALEGAHGSEAETRLRRALSPTPQAPASSPRSYSLRGGSKQPSSRATVRAGSDLPDTT